MSRRPEHACLAEVVPPRLLEAGVGMAQGMLAAMAGEAISLEIAVTATGSRWYVRSGEVATIERALAQLRAAYPQAGIERIAGERRDLDPAAPGASERAVTVALL